MKILKLVFCVGLLLGNGVVLSKIIEVTDADFEKVVLKAQQPVIVDFYAEWCGPCKTFKPVFAQLSEKYHHDYQFVSVNVDKTPLHSKKYSISNIPTLAVFNKGTMQGACVGGVQPDSFEKEVKRCLTQDVKQSAPVNNALQNAGMLVLQAISSENIAMLEQLIDQGLNLDEVYTMPMPPIGMHKGKELAYTALSIALGLNNKKIVTLLIEKGASPDITFKHLDGSVGTAEQMLEKSKEEFIKNTDEMIAYLKNCCETKKSKKA